jgi:hypothetical protein
MISEFNRFFLSQSTASTYKPTFLKCLLDIGDCKSDEGKEWIVENEESFIVDLNFVAARFLRYYWPLHFKFKLKQEATKKNQIAVYRILKEHKKKIKVKSTPAKKYLCSPKFSSLRKITIDEGIKPQVLRKLLNDCDIYTILKGSKKIEIKKDIVVYMKNNKKILESALNHMIAKLIEKYNKDFPNVSRKLEEKIPRKTLDIDVFEKIIQDQNSCCFYCGTKRKSFAQEHFIPWNWVYDTEKFNIVAACKKPCNSSKNDKLPDIEFLDLILDRNDTFDDLPHSYSRDFFKTLFESCWIEYHGKQKKLWKPKKKNET